MSDSNQDGNAAVLKRGSSSTEKPLTAADFPEFTPERELLDNNGIVGFLQQDARGRPFRLMRSQFSKRLKQHSAKLVAVTSGAPNAGKSFIAVNLAAALSRVRDQTIYLVDLDMYRGSIAESLGMQVEVGIADYLNDETVEFESIGRRITGTQLVVFPTAISQESSTEALTGPRFEQMISRLRNNGDNAIVLIDLPPVFANDDTMIVCQQLDGYIIVAENGVSTQRQTKEVISLLNPKPCLGAVLNRYHAGLFESYGYGYGYGSDAYSNYEK